MKRQTPIGRARKTRTKEAQDGVPARLHPAVLLVDDEPQILRLAAEMFKDRLPDVTVYTAEDSVQGTQKLFELRPDLLITDTVLGGAPGDELAQIAKTERRLRGTKVLALGQDTREARRSALAAGADAFLAKPFEPRELLKAVLGLLPALEADELLDEEADPGVEELGEGPEPPEIRSEDEEADNTEY